MNVSVWQTGAGGGSVKKGGAKCPHNRQKSQCWQCEGSSTCEHRRILRLCKQCNGLGICEHNRQRNKCKQCVGSSMCEHNRQRSGCKQCVGQVALVFPPLLPECWWWLDMVAPVDKQMADEEQMVPYETSVLLLKVISS